MFRPDWLAGKDTKVWGFVSAVEPNLPAPVLHLPR